MANTDREPSRQTVAAVRPAASSERSPARLGSSTMESHAALSASLQAVYGNTHVLGALAGADSALDELVSGTLMLATAGVQLGEGTTDIWTPSAVSSALEGPVAREADGSEISPAAAQRVARALGGRGSSLPATVAMRLSAAFDGADLSAVRVHTGSAAVAAAESISARAFTVGNDIVFGREGLHPETDAGLALLAHEITHVIQHQEGRLGATGSAGMRVSSPTDATELEAERQANAVVAAMPDVEAALPQDGLSDIDPFDYISLPAAELNQESGSIAAAPSAASDTDAVLSRSADEDDQVAKPAVEGKKLGVWREITSAELWGGAEIPPPSHEKSGFTEYQKALAWGAMKVSGGGADGGVVVQTGDKYHVFNIKVKSWVYDFSRANVEEGIDSVTTEGGEVRGIVCFLTNDGHAVPPTVSRSSSTDTPVYIVDRDDAGNFWHATDVPDQRGYTDIAAQAKEGKLDSLSKDEAIALFKGMVKSKAIAAVNANKKKVDELEATCQSGSGAAENDPHWQRLRELTEKDQLLAAKQELLESQHTSVCSAFALSQMDKSVTSGLLGHTEYEKDLLEKMSSLKAQIEEIKNARATLRRSYPELGAVDTEAVTPTTSNAEMFKGMQEKFKDLRAELEKLHTSIHEDDTPISKLGPIVRQTQVELGVGEGEGEGGGAAGLGQHINGWLSSQDTSEKIITFGGTLAGIALGIGAIIASGGWALVLGLAGAGVGLGTAAYEFERADDLYTASKAGVGDSQFVDDPEAAKFNYIMGWVNLVLAGLDLGLAVKAGTTVLKGGKAAEAMMGMADATVFANLKPEQIVQFKKALDLRQAGKLAEAEALLKTLKGTLGEETFEAANRLFGKSALLDELFGATSKLTIEAKQSLSYLSDDVLRQVAGKGDAFAEQTAALIRKVDGAMEPDALAKLAMEVDPKVLAMLERKYGGRALATLGDTFEPKTLKGLTEAELEGLGKTAQKDPEKFSRLNLGSGQNPMDGAINVDLKPAQGVDLVSDANKIGLKPGTQVEVHAVNPYGFNPVSKETARVMKPGGLLYVTGTSRNPFAKAVSQQEALEAGFEIVETMSGIHPKHQFGVQALSNGNPLNTASSTTTIYRKLP